MGEPDLAAVVEAYNAAWNRHDLEAITARHHPEIVFHNHTTDERVEGADAVARHIGAIFERWPDLAFRGRGLHVGESFVASEWTATASDRAGRRLEWDGVDLFPFRDGLIARKDVYSGSATPRVLDGSESRTS